MSQSTAELETRNQCKGTYSVVSLGCPKNLVDSERMLGLLGVDGYCLVADAEGTDFVVVNTCGFIEAARAESYSAIEEMLELKRDGTIGGVIVAGCLAERQREALLDMYPEVDHWMGVFAREEVAKVADRLVGGLNEQRVLFRPAPARAQSDRGRLRLTPPHFAYLKISEGCDRLCTFCAIPGMRGPHVSKPIEEVVAEARELVASGVRELILVAQDTTYYGLDLYGEPRLADLLEQLDRIEGIDWIRLMYLYPIHFSDRLIEVMAGARRIVPYADMPLQHINDAVLRRMNRRVTRRETEELIERLRGAIPELVLRTTLIAGFPGETEEQFDELVEFVQQARFERLGVFPYSVEPGTPAEKLDGHLDDETKTSRQDCLMREQREIAFDWSESQVGRQHDVILDIPIEEEDNVWHGRTAADAPEIDGGVYVSGRGLRAGQIVRCEIVAARGYDLVGAPIGKPR